jgi:hypothetical protein
MPDLADIARELQQLRHDVIQLQKSLDRQHKSVRLSEEHLTTAVQRIEQRLETAYKNHRTSLGTLRTLVEGIVRALFIAPRLSASGTLQARRFGLRSRDGSDGLLLALLDAADVETRTFVDLGSGSSGGGCAVLAFELGWYGLMVEGREEAAAKLQAEWPHLPVRCAMLQPDTVGRVVAEMMAEAGLPMTIDALSLDIDSVDYWVFESLDISPRVLMLEYNAYFGPTASVTVPKDFVGRVEPEYFGASLTALTSLARRKGFDLVICEESGLNAFFVRRDLAPALPRQTPAQAYRRIRGRRPTTPEELFARCEAKALPLVHV